MQVHTTGVGVVSVAIARVTIPTCTHNSHLLVDLATLLPINNPPIVWSLRLSAKEDDRCYDRQLRLSIRNKKAAYHSTFSITLTLYIRGRGKPEFLQGSIRPALAICGPDPPIAVAAPILSGWAGDHALGESSFFLILILILPAEYFPSSNQLVSLLHAASGTYQQKRKEPLFLPHTVQENPQPKLARKRKKIFLHKNLSFDPQRDRHYSPSVQKTKNKKKGTRPRTTHS